ncbi:MAG TPA: NAD(P)/FAD-dependent oxidoreductase [Bacillota bacterium]|nr:NAD(P)/FAD-dependent oxidoreductase [Bacillota bacterium]
MERFDFDVLIIGAGAVGNAIAREITKKDGATVCVLEKEPDTAFGISGRNSGVLHAGFNNKPGSLVAKLCVQGSEGFEREAADLGVEFKRTGKLIVARFEEDMEALQNLKEQGEANGVRELRIIGREELKEKAGYDAGAGALWSGMTGIFDPFQYTVALAEAAAEQGAEFRFGRQVAGITPQGPATASFELATFRKPAVAGGFLVTAQNLSSGREETYRTGVVINSAGLFADEICRMAGIEDYKIYPCRGEYHILDRKQGKRLSLPIYPIPNEKEGGLGVHLTPAVSGNILIGPSAEYLSESPGGEHLQEGPGTALPQGFPDRESYATTRSVMDQLRSEGRELFPDLDVTDCIHSFAGVRPKLAPESEGGYADFVIEESGQVSGFIQLVGIESPGMTASIPIAKMVAKMADEIMDRNRKAADRGAQGMEAGSAGAGKPFHEAGFGSNGSSIFAEPGDEKMICRCEGITEAALLAAYDRILEIGAIPTVKGLKNRTRVTMGNCQGSFCTINIIELLEKKRGVDPLTILWNGFGSRMFEGRVK